MTTSTRALLEAVETASQVLYDIRSDRTVNGDVLQIGFYEFNHAFGLWWKSQMVLWQAAGAFAEDQTVATYDALIAAALACHATDQEAP